MKTCSNTECKQPKKDESEFNKDNRPGRTLQAYCKDCQKEYSKWRYEHLSESHNDAAMERYYNDKSKAKANYQLNKEHLKEQSNMRYANIRVQNLVKYRLGIY